MEIINQTESFFCASCQMEFQQENDYKQHYKTDLHRYNIKRKLINLSPISTNEFNTKKQLLSKQKKDDTKLNDHSSSDKCEICRKTFSNSLTYTQHIQSKKHKEQEKNQENKESQKKNENVIYKKNDQKYEDKFCIFCDKDNEDLEGHMNVVHGFFISEKEYLTDASGLLKYLNEKITEGLFCIYCENKNTKDFKTPDAVKKHMQDRGHCFMSTDYFEEYVDYYDFSKQFEEAKKIAENQKYNKNLNQEVIEVISDNEDWESEDDKKQEIQKKQQKKQKKTLVIDQENENSKVNEEDEWESEEEESEYQNPEKAKEEKLKKLKIHRLRIYKATVNSLGELELPNGKILGHRKYRNYYNMYYRSMNVDSKIKQIMGEEAFTEKKNQLIKVDYQHALIRSFQHLQFLKQVDKVNKKELHKLGLKNIQHHFRIQNPIC